MKKSIIFAAIAAVVLSASCAKNETFTKVGGNEVSFGAYSGRTQSKAGVTDDMNLDALKLHGFGVFATYSGTAGYSASTDDFMYNQLVKNYDANGDGTVEDWEYTPVKYWPNPTNGQSADAQKVSFFAYAPYCDPAAASADNSYGVTGFSIDATTKHNLVHYTFSSNKPNVDLLWGYKTGANLTDADVDSDVNVNLTRTTETIKFTFRHLFSKLGGSQEGDPAAVGANGLIIKASPVSDPTDDYIAGTTDDFGTATGTKITVSKIVVESAPADGTLTDINGNIVAYATGAQTGKLDLYTGSFNHDVTPVQAIQFAQTVSADAAEIAAGASEIADDLKEPASAISDFGTDIPKGVTKTAVNVYKDEANPIILLPGTAPVVNVTVTYTVRTYDAKLPVGYTEVPQTVFGQVKFPTIEPNKKYNLRIILGLNSAKFEATVDDWTLERSDTNGDGVIDDNDDVTVGTPYNL